MDILKRFANVGVIPAVVIDKVEDAVPTAKALLAGGVDVMEITFRTAAAPEAIKRVSEECPEMLVGAGTVITLEQCKQAVEMGSKFIVAPGFNPEVVRWCVENDISITPGCVTPSDISAAIDLGLKVVKFFPASVYGGLPAMKALSGPFGQIKFVPTGGVNAQNLAEYMAEPFIHAVGGTWFCAKADISAGNFEKITALCKEARANALGYEVVHVGINCASGEDAMGVANAFNGAFGFPVKDGNSSVFAGTGIEVMKTPFRGAKGHIGIKTNFIERAKAYMERQGFEFDESSANYKDGQLKAIYFKDEIAGFALHLVQK